MHHSKSFSPPFHPVEGAAGPVASGGDTSRGSSGETAGERLARLRKQKLLTQSELARRLGVTVTAVCYWEQDRSRPKAARLEALAKLLGVPVADLVAAASPRRSAPQSLVSRMRRPTARPPGPTPPQARPVIESARAASPPA
ncbi:MAG: helix-turn-helix transcriptional regulator, partial [Sphingopyxis sp.]|nr:helix-turn-helix transcriptional regulator [Sphingopyxis sp.]